MSDLNKLMEKLKSNKPVEETAQKVIEKPKVEDLQVKAPAQNPVELETYDPSDDDDLDDEDDDDLDDEVIDEVGNAPQSVGSDNLDLAQNNDTDGVKSPQETEGLKQSPVEHEMAMLQNDGIFRRELLITLKELVDVQKVNTQALLDLKDLYGGLNGKKTK